LEKATVPLETRVVFFSVVGTAADGWTFDCADGSKGCVTRLAGETNEQLSERAGIAARLANPGRRIVFLNQIDG
jgi:hypothetical protein